MLKKLSSAKKADLLVMVHRRKHGIEGLVNASMTKRIAMGSAIPLLVLPERSIVRFFSIDKKDS